MQLHARAFETSLGEMVASVDPAGALVRLAFRHGGRGGDVITALHVATADPGPVARVVEQVDAYFRGELQTFDLLLAPRGTPFQQRAWLPRALFESSLIVFSVLLALLLNEWRAGVAQRGRVDLAISAIRWELEENHRLVSEARAYHLRLVESFEASVEAGAETPDLGVATQGLLAPAHLLRTAWESAEDAGLLTHLPYETVLKLSSVYARQADYESLSRSLGRVTYEQVIQQGFERLLRQYERYILVQRDFAGREAVLAESYRDVLEALR